MDHSISGYLRRESTEKLENFLEKCRTGEIKENYSNVIPLVEEEIAKRKAKNKTAT